jgi:dimethylaniline monooxygenase (N-oxide forming)
MVVTDPKKCKIIIVGAGPSGLVALKEFRNAGFDATVYEADPGVGGAFRVAYENMFLTISNRLMGYSDFPDPAPLEYSTRERYVEYLECYATLYGLNPHMHFNTTITGAKLNAAGKWEVTAESEGKTMDLTCDRLMVATGSNHTPKYAPVPGYTGQILHSSEWRGAENADVAGKRVMVIGASESAADVSADSSDIAKSVVLWSRRPVILGPRFINDRSNDELKSMKNQDKEGVNIWDLLETITVNQVSQLESTYHYCSERLDLFKGLVKNGNRDAMHLLGVINLNACMSVPHGTTRTDQIYAVPKTTRMLTAAAAGRVDLFIAKKAKFEGKKITFSEFSQKNFEWPMSNPNHKEEYEADVIIMCTGFKTDFKWLEADIDYNARTWFKNCIPPGYEDKLAFLGWTRPHQGAIPACSEMLCRYLVLLYTGQKTLPADWKEQIVTEKMVADGYYLEAPGYNTVVDYPSFMWAMSKLIGCEPRRPSIFNWKRLVQYYTFPMWPCFFREYGPDARPEMMDYCLNQHGAWDSIAPKGIPVYIGGKRGIRRALTQVLIKNPIFYLLTLFGTNGKNYSKGWFWAKSKRFVGVHGVHMGLKDVLQL